MLKIELESSSLAPSAQGAVDLITNKRTINTNVLVEDGGIVVLGGLISRQPTRRRAARALPRAHSAHRRSFKTRSANATKTNLMVFIRPKILRDGAQAAIETNAKYNYMRDQQQKRNGNRELPAAAARRDEAAAAAGAADPPSTAPQTAAARPEQPEPRTADAEAAAPTAPQPRQSRRRSSRQRSRAGSRVASRAAAPEPHMDDVAAQLRRSAACRSPSRSATACWCRQIVDGVAECVYRAGASPLAHRRSAALPAHAA